MRIILSIVLLLSSLTGPCSANTKHETLTIAPSPTPPVYEGMPTRPYSEMLRDVARITKEAGITNLYDAKLPDGETEIILD
jgi:hypothetical protein